MPSIYLHYKSILMLKFVPEEIKVIYFDKIIWYYSGKLSTYKACNNFKLVLFSQRFPHFQYNLANITKPKYMSRMFHLLIQMITFAISIITI